MRIAGGFSLTFEKYYCHVTLCLHGFFIGWRMEVTLVEIESFYGDKLISGKKCTAKDLRNKFKEAISITDAENNNFAALFCRMFQFEEISFDKNYKVDYIIDLDTYLVRKPFYT